MDKPEVEFVITATFESSWRDHESCPSSKVHYTNDKGQCDVHDEWFELPDQDELLDL